MPCYCPPPTDEEIEFSRLEKLIWELPEEGLDGGAFTLDNMTRALCVALSAAEDVTKYSLEMQIWWRDHQEFDRERMRKELKEMEDLALKVNALNKLTDYEKELLGL